MLELAGLLHDIGKLSDTFIKAETSSGVSYYLRIVADPKVVLEESEIENIKKANSYIKKFLKDSKGMAPFKERSDLTSLLHSTIFMTDDGHCYSLAEVLLLQTQNVAFEYEGKCATPFILVGMSHGVAHFEKKGADLKKSCQFLSTPFGIETELLVNKTPGLTDALRSLPLERLAEMFTDRRRAWLDKLQMLLARGVADTRRPVNEVSLWDWGFMVGSLAKATAAGLGSEDWKYKDKLSWKTLGINIDKLAVYQRAEKISDLLGLRDTLEKAYREVRTLIEETLCLGNEIFHDETGSYFLLAKEQDEEKIRSKIHEIFPKDLLPLLTAGEPSSAKEIDADAVRAAVRNLFVNTRQKALKALEYPVRSGENLHDWEEVWKGTDEDEVCTVCGMRPVGYLPNSIEERKKLDIWANPEKARDRHVCCICLARRGRRSEAWAKGPDADTIWLDEVADNNGRLALVAARFGLDKWLDGTLLSTLRITSEQTKNPSPARLYRIWRTTKQFWQEVGDDLLAQATDQDRCRLALIPKPSLLEKFQDKLGNFHAYELDIQGVRINVVWDRPHRRFITAENLVYFCKRAGWQFSELASRLVTQSLKIMEPSSYGNDSVPLGVIKFIMTQDLGTYRPTISILEEPATMLTLVPADAAMKLAADIKGKYEKEMGKVRDRLPLHIGLVFFPHQTPIRAVLSAGKSMLKIEDNFRPWGVSKVKEFANAVEITFLNGVTWNVSTVMGDGNTKDEWYPFLLTKDPKDQQDLLSYSTHITKIRPGPHHQLTGGPNVGKEKKVWVLPSTFDFEFLDTAGRRFEVVYNNDGKRPGRDTRPYFLEELDELTGLWEDLQNLEISQIHALVGAIEEKRFVWSVGAEDAEFRQFVADALAVANWQGNTWHIRSDEDQLKLIEAGVTGRLSDVAELYLKILKARPENKGGTI